MNLKRQLMLVSLLTLVLPWAGCQFIKETESALREGQQQMLAGTAQAIADSLAQFPQEFIDERERPAFGGGPVYAHPLEREPLLDGYFSDWSIEPATQRSLRGADGPARYVFGTIRQQLWLYVEVRDNEVRYAEPGVDGDSIAIVTGRADGGLERLTFRPEAPGRIVARHDDGRIEQRIAAQWQDTPGGYQLEARVPRQLLGQLVGLEVRDVAGQGSPVVSRSYAGPLPGRLVSPSPLLQSVLRGYVQPGLRLIVTDRDGWRLASSGGIGGGGTPAGERGAGLMRLAYDLILEPGEETTLAEPDPSGREQQSYIGAALGGQAATAWFRSAQTGRAVVAVAQPVWSGNVQTGAVVLQQGTDAILSLTSDSLARLMGFTLIATVVAAGALLGYASWLSHRVRRLSRGAQRALDDSRAHAGLPSLAAGDEIGDLSRNFANVLRQLGDYNEYLRSLASKLSHELRTPLTIVRSSLDNLDHEPLPEEARQYTERARDGVERLKKILNAMSEANRVEELITGAERESFDLRAVLESTVAAYADAWPARQFRFEAGSDPVTMHGAPELVIQMLDKLVDNAVDFSKDGDDIGIALQADDHHVELSVSNPGPPLPDTMRGQLFDSMISVRGGDAGQHLGLGLFIARLIAEGHGGGITAENVEGGVCFRVRMERKDR